MVAAIVGGGGVFGVVVGAAFADGAAGEGVGLVAVHGIDILGLRLSVVVRV